MTDQILLGITVLELFCLVAGAIVFFELISFFVSDHLDVPFVPTSTRLFPAIYDALEVRAGDTVIELGSGDARFLIASALRQPNAHFVGIERNPFLHIQARLRKRLYGNPQNVELRRGNLFNQDVSQASKIYAYLLPDVMNQLLPVLESDFHGTLASRAFPFAGKSAISVIELSKKPGNHGQHLLYVYNF